MKIKLALTLVIWTALWLLSMGIAFSKEKKESLTGHVFYGTMSISDNDPDSGEGDFDLAIFGADAQKPIGGGTFKYGFETGMIFSLDSDVRMFSASSGSEGGSAAVSVDVYSLLIDYFAGGFLSFEPANWLRLYVGAGPLIVWAKWESEPKPSTAREINSQSESGFGVGVYARTGLDLFVTEKIGLAIGARVNETTLSLKYEPGGIDVEGWQYYFAMAVRF